MVKLELERPAEYSPDMSNVPERYLGESFETMDFSGKEPVRDFLAAYLKGFVHSGKDSLVLRPGEFAARTFVALYRAVASRVTADAVRFWDWPPQSAWLRSLGDWRSEHELLDGLWGARFVFLFNVGADEKDLPMLRAAVGDCSSMGRRLLAFTRDDGFHERLPADLAAMLDEKVLPVRIKEEK